MHHERRRGSPYRRALPRTPQPGLQPELETRPPLSAYAAFQQPSNTHSEDDPQPRGNPSELSPRLMNTGEVETVESLNTAPSSAFSGSNPSVQLGLARGNPRRNEGKISVSIDFGTTFSSVAYGSTRIAGGRIQQIINWPGATETLRKIPTCLLYDKGHLIAWGLEAKNVKLQPGMSQCERFPLFLEPQALRLVSPVDPSLPPLPPGKQPRDLIVDFLSCLWQYAVEQITRDIGAIADLNSAYVWLIVPATWGARGGYLLRKAGISAGLVACAHAGDCTWRDRLRTITEPEAAVVHCAHLSYLHQLKPNQNFIVCNTGDRTVNLAVYQIIGEMQNLEIADMCAGVSANCGSLSLDHRFSELVKATLQNHPAHLDPPSLECFTHHFSETDKQNYRGVIDDDIMFYFTCLNPDDPHDPSVGLINGQLLIPGDVLRREVFDPVVNEILQLLEDQITRLDQPIHALLLVGGFARSEYLKQRIHEQFGIRIRIIIRPPDAETAALQGAATSGFAKRRLVSSVIAPRSYLIKITPQAEQEDWLKRPEYIKNDGAGIPVCENRLQYLVSKGAILRKGQRLTTRFRKYLPQDSTFIVTLYTSDSDKIIRYTDEDETTELDKWTADLPFKQIGDMLHTGGFIIDFELGFELDSAELRVILLCMGGEYGRVTIDFFT